MHGLIFVQLKKYCDARLGAAAWDSLRLEAGMPGRDFLAAESYADGDALALITAACRITRQEPAAVLEDFGAFMTPDLMKLYGALAPRTWRTLDFLEHLEDTIHRVVRQRMPGATPPALQCARTADGEVTITYTSPRKLCALARGLAHGVAGHFNEQVRIHEPSCMLRGASSCQLIVRRQ